MNQSAKFEVMRYEDLNSVTNRNKFLSSKETVYDRCAYVGCYNGKYINGRRLFHFPAETDRRLEMWIERCGNFRLRTWAATSLRKAGLCGDHFDEKSFTNATRKSLRRNVVPRHYTEDFKYRSAKKNNRESNESKKEIGTSDDDNDPLNCDRGSQSPDLNYSLAENSLENNPEESSLDSSDCVTETTRQKSRKLRPPSPLVEFIVEELDESLLESRSPIVETMISENETGKIENSSNEQNPEVPIIHQESPIDEIISKIESNSDSESQYLPRNDCPSNFPENCEIKKESLWTEIEINEEIDGPTIMPRSNVVSCSNENHERTITNLRNENKQLRKTMRLLKQNLRRSKAREENYLKVREMLRNVDEFLNIQECQNPVSRAMVKLALHKPKTPYTKEEKDFAAKLYRNSSVAFLRLRRAGCNFPGKSTMKRWIAEDNDEDLTCQDTFIQDDDDDSVVDEIDGRHGIIADHEQPNDYENEVVVDMNEAVDHVEMVIDDLVEHLNEEIADADIQHEEYIEALPPDDNDDFK